jgi:ActR/RegA family two-component response regulator
MSDHEFAVRLRANKALQSSSRCLLVVISGWNNEATRARTLASGFEHHLVKPADFTTVRSLTADHIQLTT